MMNNMLKKAGYYADEKLAKKVGLFYKAGLRNESNVPCALLTGAPGAGKTVLAEKLAQVIEYDLHEEVVSLFVQMHKGIDAENLMARPNTRAIINRDAVHAVSDGILVKGLIESRRHPVLITIDELDKAGEDSDALLLDFLNSGRITDGHNTWERGNHPVWVVITSNGNRELDDSLLNRCRRIPVERPSAEQVAEMFELPENHHAIRFYAEREEMSIRQLRSYLEDIDFEDNFDEDAMSQYVQLDEEDYDIAKEDSWKVRQMHDTAYPLTVSVGSDEEPAEYAEEVIDALCNWSKEKGSARANTSAAIKENNGKFYVLVYDVELAERMSHVAPIYMEERGTWNDNWDSTAKAYESRLWVPKELIEASAESDDAALVKVKGKILCGRMVNGYFLADLKNNVCEELFGFAYEKGGEEDGSNNADNGEFEEAF